MALFPRQDRKDGIVVADDIAREAFLGTLRSELDEDTPLEGAFAELYARFGALRDAYQTGRLEPRVFGRALRDLRVIDPEGYQWTIGASTGRWYRRLQSDAGKWMAAPAPVGTGMLVDHTGEESGWAVEDWEARRAKRLQEDAERARRDEERREAAPEARKRLSIDEMFDKYVDTVEEVDSYSIENTILAVDDLPESDWTGGASEH